MSLRPGGAVVKQDATDGTLLLPSFSNMCLNAPRSDIGVNGVNLKKRQAPDDPEEEPEPELQCSSWGDQRTINMAGSLLTLFSKTTLLQSTIDADTIRTRHPDIFNDWTPDLDARTRQLEQAIDIVRPKNKYVCVQGKTSAVKLIHSLSAHLVAAALSSRGEVQRLESLPEYTEHKEYIDRAANMFEQAVLVFKMHKPPEGAESPAVARTGSSSSTPEDATPSPPVTEDDYVAFQRESSKLYLRGKCGVLPQNMHDKATTLIDAQMDKEIVPEPTCNILANILKLIFCMTCEHASVSKAFVFLKASHYTNDTSVSDVDVLGSEITRGYDTLMGRIVRDLEGGSNRYTTALAKVLWSELKRSIDNDAAVENEKQADPSPEIRAWGLEHFNMDHVIYAPDELLELKKSYLVMFMRFARYEGNGSWFANSAAMLACLTALTGRPRWTDTQEAIEARTRMKRMHVDYPSEIDDAVLSEQIDDAMSSVEEQQKKLDIDEIPEADATVIDRMNSGLKSIITLRLQNAESSLLRPREEETQSLFNQESGASIKQSIQVMRGKLFEIEVTQMLARVDGLRPKSAAGATVEAAYGQGQTRARLVADHVLRLNDSDAQIVHFDPAPTSGFRPSDEEKKAYLEDDIKETQRETNKWAADVSLSSLDDVVQNFIELCKLKVEYMEEYAVIAHANQAERAARREDIDALRMLTDRIKVQRRIKNDKRKIKALNDIIVEISEITKRSNSHAMLQSYEDLQDQLEYVSEWCNSKKEKLCFMARCYHFASNLRHVIGVMSLLVADAQEWYYALGSVTVFMVVMSQGQDQPAVNDKPLSHYVHLYRVAYRCFAMEGAKWGNVVPNFVEVIAGDATGLPSFVGKNAIVVFISYLSGTVTDMISRNTLSIVNLFVHAAPAMQTVIAKKIQQISWVALDLWLVAHMWDEIERIKGILGLAAPQGSGPSWLKWGYNTFWTNSSMTSRTAISIALVYTLWYFPDYKNKLLCLRRKTFTRPILSLQRLYGRAAKRLAVADAVAAGPGKGEDEEGEEGEEEEEEAAMEEEDEEEEGEDADMAAVDAYMDTLVGLRITDTHLGSFRVVSKSERRRSVGVCAVVAVLQHTDLLEHLPQRRVWENGMTMSSARGLKFA